MEFYLNKYKEANKKILLDLKDFKFKDEICSDNVTSFGFYDLLGGKILGLSSINESLFLFVEGSCYKLDTNLKVNYKRVNNVAHLSITKNIHSYELKYFFEESLSTLSYSEENEDSDFGLWVYNVLNSKERINIFKEYNNNYIEDFV
ncbi:hypothetical protein R5O24_03870 [Tenacibaculum maritimum]|uniref:hypothetical protein n=1 Tax=Tenacibaculum maritimum TaxID=107401 RepID=UPI00389032C5